MSNSGTEANAKNEVLLLDVLKNKEWKMSGPQAISSLPQKCSWPV